MQFETVESGDLGIFGRGDPNEKRRRNSTKWCKYFWFVRCL